MNKTLSLTKVLLKNGSGGSSKKGKRIKIPSSLLMAILLVVGLIPIFGFISMFVSAIYDGLVEIGQEGIIPALGLSAVSLIVFFFGIFYVINVFFFSKDIEHLLPLPLKSTQILSAKFIVTLLYEYLTELFILMPILITYGIKSGAGIAYYFYSLLIFLTLPIIPLLLASVISMLIMRFTNIAKNKDRYRMIGGAAAIILALGFNVFIQRFAARSMDPEAMQELLLEGNNSFLSTITTLFPNTKLGALSLIHASEMQGLLYLLGFLALAAAAYFVFMLIGKALYFQSVIGMSEASSRRKLVSGEQLDRMTHQNSVLKAYTMKEMRILLRTPAYFTNCVLLCILFPVLLCLPFVVQQGSMDAISQLAPYLGLEEYGGIILAAAFAVVLFTSGANATAATAISREGTGLFVNKYLPVPYIQIILSKVLSGVILCFVTVLLMIAALYFLFGFSLSFVVLFLLLSIPAIWFSCLTGIIIDLNFPKLNWDTEQKAVKQNFNSLFNMLASLLAAAPVVIAAILLNLSWIQVFFGLLIVFGLLDLMLIRIIKAKAAKWWNKIEI